MSAAANPMFRTPSNDRVPYRDGADALSKLIRYGKAAPLREDLVSWVEALRGRPLKIKSLVSYEWGLASRAHQTARATAILSALYADGPSLARPAGLSKLIGHLFDLLGTDHFAEIDELIARAEPSKLAPEYLLGLLRGTFIERDKIPSWNAFLRKVDAEFNARGRPDVEELLQGLQERG